jgi:hypothetical protein
MMDPYNNNGRRRRRERERKKEGETQFFGIGAGCRCCCATAEVARLPADRHKHKNPETKQQGHMTVTRRSCIGHGFLTKCLCPVFFSLFFFFLFLFLLVAKFRNLANFVSENEKKKREKKS